jgi:hypothetical protein
MIVPETKNCYERRYQALLSSSAENSTDNELSEHDDPKVGWRSTWTERWDSVKHHTAFIRTNANTFCIVLAFLIASAGKQTLRLMIQYVSKRFSWSIARASLLTTLKGIITLVALLLFLPRLSVFLSRHMSPLTKVFRISQGSAWLLALGTTLMAVASNPAIFIPGVCIFALGCGFYAAIRSLATGLVTPNQVGVLNTTLALAQSTKMIIAGPISASAFRRGIELGGFWLGLPCRVCAGLFIASSFLTSGIRISQEEEGS